MKYTIPCYKLAILFLSSCTPFGRSDDALRSRLVPAEEFSKSVKDGESDKFSIFRVADPENNMATKQVGIDERRGQLGKAKENGGIERNLQEPTLRSQGELPGTSFNENTATHPYAKQGLTLQHSIELPTRQWNEDELNGTLAQDKDSATGRLENASLQSTPGPRTSVPMTSNPSLWPDEGQGASLFRDIRALQPMDVLTIIINESSEGNKKADTNTESKFTLKAAISKLFGIETKKFAANNTALDPTDLINASTEDKFEGTGETTRSGSLKARISALVIEVLPNGILRVEGTKIVSVNSEEEVMVISGLVRPRDVDASNQVDSSRVANMRIDFYGKGVVADHQEPGWGERLFQALWPF